MSSTVDKEAVTSCKFAMQAEEACRSSLSLICVAFLICVSVKFDLCSVFASVRASVRL